ncbi:hypothetical protein BH10PSE14_BH10PSE14_08680 [soil metagenome]
MFVIYDELHAEHVGEFATREEALAELRRLASVPWDQAPNVAPCMSWRTCGRQYELVEYDDTGTPWRTLSQEPALEVSQTEVKWLSGLTPG